MLCIIYYKLYVIYYYTILYKAYNNTTLTDVPAFRRQSGADPITALRPSFARSRLSSEASAAAFGFRGLGFIPGVWGVPRQNKNRTAAAFLE